jgi:hypothetical protein
LCSTNVVLSGPALQWFYVLNKNPDSYVFESVNAPQSGMFSRAVNAAS